MYTRGVITYYRKNGLVLYSPHKTEYGDVTIEPSCIAVYRNEIVLSSSMGQRAAYQIDNTHIDLHGKAIEQFILYKDTPTWGEQFVLTKDTLYYHN